MNASDERFARLVAMMDDYLSHRSAPDRDRLMQQYLAEARTTTERLRGLVVLMDHGIAWRNRWSEDAVNG